MWLEEEAECEDRELKGPVVFCMQAEHAGTRTYYFSTDSHEEQEEWIRAMSEAAEVNVQPTQRCSSHMHRVILEIQYTHMGNHILLRLFDWACPICPVMAILYRLIYAIHILKLLYIEFDCLNFLWCHLVVISGMIVM